MLDVLVLALGLGFFVAAVGTPTPANGFESLTRFLHVNRYPRIVCGTSFARKRSEGEQP